MAFKPKYILFDDDLTEMFELPHSNKDNLLSEYDILAGIIKYALSHEGMTGQTLNHDSTLWRALDVNPHMPITIQTIWHYLAKYLEEAPHS